MAVYWVHTNKAAREAISTAFASCPGRVLVVFTEGIALSYLQLGTRDWHLVTCSCLISVWLLHHLILFKPRPASEDASSSSRFNQSPLALRSKAGHAAL